VLIFVLLAGCDSGVRASGDSRVATAQNAPTDTLAPAGSALTPESVPATESTAATGTDPSFETPLVPLHDVEVFARADGQVVALDVEEGARVHAGDRLAQIDDREQRATLDEREAQVTRAEAAWERAQRLHEQKLTADEQYVAAEADWRVAKAQRDRARLECERCAVRAPIAGLVALRRTQMGQMVKQNDLLFRLGNPDTLRAELLLPESRLGTVHAGQPVRLMLLNGGGSVDARVTRVSPLVDPASGTFRVVIDLDNRRARLPGGVSVRADFAPLAGR
jgi:RND family efflux transporter MFP subunit